jgi:hypothetical protein
MARIARQLTALVGNTPLLEFSNFNASKGLKAQVIGKLEYFNPARPHPRGGRHERSHRQSGGTA